MRRRPSGSGDDEDGPRSANLASASDRSMHQRGEKMTSRESNRALRQPGLHERKPSRDSTTMNGKAQNAATSRVLDNNTPWPRSSNSSGRSASSSPGADEKFVSPASLKTVATSNSDNIQYRERTARLQSPWRCSLLTLATSIGAIVLLATIINSFLHLQQDPKGCAMSYMMPMFAHFSDFDTEHTRFASKYSLYLYREGGVDEDTRVKGIPVLFIPGNAGSYKQVRPIAAEAAHYFHDVLRNDPVAVAAGKRPLDVFTVDFNEEMVAFHGQTLLDQAEYLNEAVAYILALYHNPQRSLRESGLPDPKSVIIIGHSMGGAVARTMLHMPNYQEKTINTILTLSAPHARPPVSFDATMVDVYHDVNAFWRSAFLNGSSTVKTVSAAAGRNPLDDVALVSVAGGGLDTMIPSEYTSLTSLVPDSHGFTIFTSGIPRVWTGMDHLAIMWCDQLRKALVRAIYDVVDVRRSSQTRSRPERIHALRRRLLTGLEPVIDIAQLDAEPTVHLTLDPTTSTVLASGQRLVLRSLGNVSSTIAHVLPIPAISPAERSKFTLLSNQAVEGSEGADPEQAPAVLLCGVTPSLPPGSTALSNAIHTVNKAVGATKLACKSAASDISLLPASYRDSLNAFEDRNPPFSYLQYESSKLSEYHFIVVLEKPAEISHLSHGTQPRWLFAEFNSARDSIVQVSKGHQELLTLGLDVDLPAARPLMTEIKIPEIHSSLFAYRLRVQQGTCVLGSDRKESLESFAPLLRQYIAAPYESKYVVNLIRDAGSSPDININVHGLSPYMPPPLEGGGATEGLSLQFWSDPTCSAPLAVKLRVDVLGSAGKLVMRYRTIFAAFPLLVIALVLRKQFQVYDSTGVFMSFTQSVDQCIRTSLPAIFLALTFFSIAMSKTSFYSPGGLAFGRGWLSNADGSGDQQRPDFAVNDLMLGTPDPFFWFLVPTFAIISVGICIVANYIILFITHTCAWVYARVRGGSATISNPGNRSGRWWLLGSSNFRIVTMCLLVLLVITIIPYQFAYVVLCVVQLGTCIRALCVAMESRAISKSKSAPNGIASANVSPIEPSITPVTSNGIVDLVPDLKDQVPLSMSSSSSIAQTEAQETQNFYNYTHSLLILFLWILPINMPVLIVWAHNLAVHWLTPFATHHNLLAVMGYIALVEAVNTRGHSGARMVPRVRGRMRHLTNVFTFALALYAAVYGVTYGYRMHYLVNALCGWFACLHFLAATFGTQVASPSDLGLLASWTRQQFGGHVGGEKSSVGMNATSPRMSSSTKENGTSSHAPMKAAEGKKRG